MYVSYQGTLHLTVIRNNIIYFLWLKIKESILIALVVNTRSSGTVFLSSPVVKEHVYVDIINLSLHKTKFMNT